MTGSTLLNLTRLNFDHFLHWIPVHYWLKMPLAYLINLTFAPFNLYEVIRYGRKIKETKVEDPVFILGHWRSGTTHLHYLLTQDPQFGYTTQKQCLFPNSFLSSKVGETFLKNFQPKTRPMDNMEIGLETPQEEEVATANTMLYSFYNAWAFPKVVWRDYMRYVCFEGFSQRKINTWKKGYLRVLKKASIYHGGRRLVLKNPANTSRIPALLELFPNAKFIHIYRHPVNIFYSTRRLYKTALPSFAYQSITEAEGDQAIFKIYDHMMHKYFEDRHLIPKENLYEVRYEDLEKNRMGELAQMYEQFGWENWEGAQPHVQAYLDSLGTYQKNVHRFTDEECARVEKEWAFAFEELDYAPQPA